MKTRTVPLVAIAVGFFVLSSCGGGGGGSGLTQPPSGPQSPPPSANAYDFNRDGYTNRVGTSGAGTASNEPLNGDPAANVAFVGGVNVTQMFTELQRGCTPQRCYPSSIDTRHGGAEVGALRVRDGVTASELLAYLRADAAFRDINLVKRWSAPPTVRMIQGATADDVFDTLNAVRLINSALPADWQLRFDDRQAAPDGQLNPGYIEVAFAPREEWPDGGAGGCEQAVGCAYTDYARNGRMTAGLALVDPGRVTSERKRVFVLLHELLHTLGRGHVSPSAVPNTIMHAAGDLGVSDFLILSELDEAALFAVHDRVIVGTGRLDANDLGPWSDVSTHVVGRLGYVPGRQEAVVFGAAWQNGNVRPWAAAPNPTELPRGLSGSASWAGRMIGMTPAAEAVAGGMDMTIQLASLQGTLAFTGLEKWAAHTGPGTLGTGAQWGDGDLHYRIAADREAFFETGGDAGEITGVFFGSRQEKVGGTLRRTDLAAGFAGARQ